MESLFFCTLQWLASKCINKFYRNVNVIQSLYISLSLFLYLLQTLQTKKHNKFQKYTISKFIWLLMSNKFEKILFLLPNAHRIILYRYVQILLNGKWKLHHRWASVSNFWEEFPLFLYLQTRATYLIVYSLICLFYKA